MTNQGQHGLDAAGSEVCYPLSRDVPMLVYAVFQQHTIPWIFAHNLREYRPIFKIFFTDRFQGKLSVSMSQKLPPLFHPVATLPYVTDTYRPREFYWESMAKRILKFDLGIFA